MTLDQITADIKETLERHGCLHAADERLGELYTINVRHVEQIVELAYMSGQCSTMMPKLEAVR